MGYLGESYDASADVLVIKGDLDAASRCARQELAIYEQLVSADPGNLMARADIGLSDVTIGDILRQNKPTEALQQIRGGLADFAIQPIKGILVREKWANVLGPRKGVRRACGTCKFS